MSWSEKIYRKRIFLWSLVIVALFLGFTWVMIPINFETNDDTGIMRYVSGAKTGSPEATVIFSMYLWGKLCSSLYALNGNVPWYAVIFLILIGISLWTICYCIMYACGNDKKAVLTGGVIFVLLYCSMFLYYSVILQFTTVAGYCGIGAIAVLLAGLDRGYRQKVWANLLLFILTLFCINIRLEAGYMVLGTAYCIGGLELIFYCFFERNIENRKRLKRAAASLAVMTAALVVSITVEKATHTGTDWGEYQEFHQERVLYTDYGKLPYDDSEVYKAVGWSENLYKLTNKWFFMDRNINTNTLRRINQERINQERINQENRERSIGLLSVLVWMFHNERMILMQVLEWGGLLILYLFYLLRQRGVAIRKLMAFLWPCIWGCGVLYFVYKGRIVRRVLESWTFLMVLPCVFQVIRDVRGNKRIPEIGVYATLLLLSAGSLLIKSGTYRIAKGVSDGADGDREIAREMDEYAVDRMDNLYIHDMSGCVSGSPWNTYPEKKPYNLIFWGGSDYNSPLYYKQLKKNGFDSLYEEDFFRDNVFFISPNDIDETLLDFMQESYPGCVCEITDRRDLFVVYRFSKAERNQ